MRKPVSFPLFLLASIIALTLVLIGLRLYFNQSRLDQQLAYQINGNQFSHLTGQTQTLPNNALKVISTPSANSQLVIKGLNIQTNLYETLLFQFNDKPSQQSLSLGITTISPNKTSEIPILYANKSQVSQFFISDLVATDSTITTISLSTPKLIDDYTLNSVSFKPKTINTLQFLYLLQTDLRQVFQPIEEQSYFLLPAYWLILVYLGVILITYFFLLYWTNRPKAIAWWMTLVMGWFALDVSYLYQTITTIPIFSADAKQWLTALLPLSPWFLGTVLSLACLKRRYGYFILALGSGYIIGSMLTALWLIAAQFYQWQLNWSIIWGAQSLLAVLILYFFRPQKCSIEELRLEKAPANRDYFMTLLLVVIAAIHLVLIISGLATELAANPAASSSNRSTAWLLSYWQQAANTSLGLAAIWGTLFVAVSFVIFGGLRYLGMTLLPAMLTCYSVLSLPLWHTSLLPHISYSETFAMLTYTTLLIIVTLFYCYREYRLLLLLIPVSVGFINNAESYALLSQGKLTVTESAHNLLHLSFDEANILSALLTHSYLLLPALLGSLIMWIFLRKRDNENNGIKVLLALIILTLALFGWGTSLMLSADNQIDLLWLNKSLLVLASLVCLVPACTYQLITKDEETIPII